jgi:hypothetical protein
VVSFAQASLPKPRTHLSHIHVTCPFHLFMLWSAILIAKVLTVQSTPVSCYFIHIRLTYLLQNRILKNTLQPVFLLQCFRDQVSHPCKRISKVVCLPVLNAASLPVTHPHPHTDSFLFLLSLKPRLTSINLTEIFKLYVDVRPQFPCLFCETVVVSPPRAQTMHRFCGEESA